MSEMIVRLWRFVVVTEEVKFLKEEERWVARRWWWGRTFKGERRGKRNYTDQSCTDSCL